ncbi:MAG TPA: hypothetical protein VIG54_04265, partial [Lysobacter sp.]
AEAADEFARRFHELIEAVTYTALFSGYCYTQFADTFQEANGLLTEDRVPKIPIEQIRKAVGMSRTHIQGAA